MMVLGGRVRVPMRKAAHQNIRGGPMCRTPQSMVRELMSMAAHPMVRVAMIMLLGARLRVPVGTARQPRMRAPSTAVQVPMSGLYALGLGGPMLRGL